MRPTATWKSTKYNQPITKKLLPFLLYLILPIALFRFYFYPFASSFTPISSSFSFLPKEKGIGNGVFDSTTRVPIKEKENVNTDLNPDQIPLAEKETENVDSFTSLSTHEKGIGNGVFDSTTTVPIKEKENVNTDLNPDQIPAKEKEIENYENVDSFTSLSTHGNISENADLHEDDVVKPLSSCDYTNGGWIQDEKGPLYNGSSCGTIKYAQNCMNNGRPDTGFLFWKWKPTQCDLQRFDPQLFLEIIKEKHLAFVGDSMARNQLESLLCMLGSVYPPNLVYTSGDDNKFRRWHFSSHNAVISIYWSPFLVKGLEKTNDGTLNHNKLYFDSVDERWANDLGEIDMVVLSIGHWYLHPAVYHDGESILGCHSVKGVNCTEIEFFDVFGKAFNTTLKGILNRKGVNDKGIDVIVTTFSPHHFEGDWDKFGACPRTKPFMEGEKVLEGMDEKMRKVEVEEVENAKTLLNLNTDQNVRLAALDVTKLAMLRPDGHPGPYMYPNPFSDGMKEHVQNDCVHWCLPGPIDTWNEIMFDIMKQWHSSGTR